MKPTSSVYRWPVLPALLILAPAGCDRSLAVTPPAAAALKTTAPAAPPTPGSASVATAPLGAPHVPPVATPQVLENDPLAKSLLKSLTIAGSVRPGKQRSAHAALEKTLNTEDFRGAVPLKKIQCFGTDDPASRQKRNAKVFKQLSRHPRSDQENSVKQRADLRGSIPRDGCVQDVRYEKAEDVVAFDRKVLGARTAASPFYTWPGSNGRTPPRWRDDGHGKKIIVATWYFLQPEDEGYDVPGKINNSNQGDRR